MTNPDAFEQWIQARAASSVPDGFADRVAEAAGRRSPGPLRLSLAILASAVFAVRIASTFLVFAAF